MLSGPFLSLYDDLSARFPPDRLIHDPLRTLAYGTDASFYRLTPQVIVRVESEPEVVAVLEECRRHSLPLTFRAAGTSLSGQAITESVLVMLGSSWNHHEILDGGMRIRLQPGVIGGYANLFLAPYGRKIGPDPASINACMVGGILANNASGMCCGTAQNSYKTLSSLRLIMADGTPLDTADEQSIARFRRTHEAMLTQIADLSRRVKSSPELEQKIRRKYSIKNTTGYSLNALVDFDDPIDILAHLMVGSEGTLAFISEVTYHTVPEHPHKATALLLFPDVTTACNAVPVLRTLRMDAVELMDRASLRSVENKEGVPSYLRSLPDAACALLVETRAPDANTLESQIRTVLESMKRFPQLTNASFTTDPTEFARLWSIRKGLLPSIGAMREKGTTLLTEDIAFPFEHLAEGTLALQQLFQKYHYSDAIIFGHALEANLHFVFCQNIGTDEEVRRYGGFMEDLARMVAERFGGSLKAEHGTGRNMAPFVEMEWGTEAYGVMKEIKAIFDPDNLLNPGVILNDDPQVHIKNLKHLPVAHPVVDTCIECGFCESHCPSQRLTLTPRQRIVVWREIARLRETDPSSERLRTINDLYQYYGDSTCATDGLCALACPVDIDTGSFIKDLREKNSSPLRRFTAAALGTRIDFATAAARMGLRALAVMEKLVGPVATEQMSGALASLSAHKLPRWNRVMPRCADRLPAGDTAGENSVVYFPSCINRTMGVLPAEPQDGSLTTHMVSLLHKAGYKVIFPPDVHNLCCGMPFSSKGLPDMARTKREQTMEALKTASGDGTIPIVSDMSPCVYSLEGDDSLALKIQEPVSFLLDNVIGKLNIKRMDEPVAVHVTCSARKMGLGEKTRALAEMCAARVVIPHDIECCGWAGDRGFTVPELTASALRSLKERTDGCTQGYSTSRTCEIGLTLHSGIPYRSIVHLVDECSEEKPV